MMLATTSISPAQCPVARSVFAPMDHHLMVAAMFRGYHAAKLIVDDEQHPQSAFLWMDDQGYAAGSPDNETFNSSLAALLAAEYPPGTSIELAYPTAEWEGALRKALAGREMLCMMRDYFARSAARTNELSPSADSITFHPVEEVIDRPHLLHHARLLAEIELCNPSLDAFLNRGFGICAVESETALAGWCLSENWSDGRCEVGIETVEPYRQKGIATAMTLTFTRLAYELGLAQIGWHCWSDNIPSIATAKSAGFEKVCEYPVLIVR